MTNNLNLIVYYHSEYRVEVIKLSFKFKIAPLTILDKFIVLAYILPLLAHFIPY